MFMEHLHKDRNYAGSYTFILILPETRWSRNLHHLEAHRKNFLKVTQQESGQVQV